MFSPYLNKPFFVRGIRVEITHLLGTYIFTKNETSRLQVVKYLQDEGFWDRQEQLELVEKS